MVDVYRLFYSEASGGLLLQMETLQKRIASPLVRNLYPSPCFNQDTRRHIGAYAGSRPL